MGRRCPVSPPVQVCSHPHERDVGRTLAPNLQEIDYTPRGCVPSGSEKPGPTIACP